MSELYHSPTGVLDYQAKCAAGIYASSSILNTADPGTGKTHISMIASAMLHEDSAIDTTLLTVEAGKVKDWLEELATYTQLDVTEYTGTPERRARRMSERKRVLVTSYETGRTDICDFKPGGTAVLRDGPLMEYLADRRVLAVYDEAARLGNRKNQLYRANWYLLKTLRRRKAPGRHTRTLALTATTVRRDPMAHYNLGRLTCPERMPSVADFERDYVLAWDPADEDRPLAWKNLSPSWDVLLGGVTPLTEVMAPFTQRIRKSDPEVAKYFPRRTEMPPTVLRLSERHWDLIDAVHKHFDRLSEEQQKGLYGLTRLLVNHPEAVLYSDGALARQVARIVGPGGLRAVGSNKIEETLRWIERRLGNSGQGVVFTFFGQAVLPIVQRELESAGYRVSVNHGMLSPTQKQRAKAEFTSGGTQIFLSSDAGAKGLNLGCARALLHYEPPSIHDIFVQRSDRVHRVDSPHSEITIDTLVAKGTPDEPAMSMMLTRNEYSDHLNDSDLLEGKDPGEDHLTAAQRRQMFTLAREAA